MHDKDAQRILNFLAKKGPVDFFQLDERIKQFMTDGKVGTAAALCQGWIQRNPGHPQLADAWFTLGTLLSNDGNHAAARDAYATALEFHLAIVNPTPMQRLDRLKLHYCLGQEYVHLKEEKEGVELWRWIVKHANPADPTERKALIRTVNRMGEVFLELHNPPSALKSVTASLHLDPEQPEIVARLTHVRRQLCQWPIHEPLGEVRPELMDEPPMIFYSIDESDDPGFQLVAARKEIEHIFSRTDFSPFAPAKGYRHDRIRIGYASSDFKGHPVAHLTVELFELHDRDRFDVHAFDWSKEDDSVQRQRIIAACGERFIRIDAMNDIRAAQLIRKHEIDVLIDLQGLTAGCRPAIFARRPAPIQISYLGLPATAGIPGIDYILADRFLIPEEYAPHYAEKPLYLPEVFQSCDTKRVHAPIPDRAECGLPEEGFVFCCFNSDHKYNPEMLDAWARILAQVPGSVLWLSVSNPSSEENLEREALARGIDKNRLFFARRTTVEAYLARFAAADLFLDTFPFNAGTTANDALWMGLPLLTRAGRSFGSRMGGALLSAAGIEELIAHDLADYEAKAVALARDPERYQRLRARCGELRTASVLFDMPRFTRNLENVLAERVERLRKS
jgi:predicted O-linked N-acetylglucosamine transferase (SPINDLY family)